ncbi:MAG: V-type ATP synthase subunit D [Firmicutes bacterium]|nr:V-type ATP synthase subunit D [Bacillota bacterium]
MVRLQVNPTRIELNKCKTRLKAAIKGHKLLKDKSDEMIRQFLQLAKDAKLLRNELDIKLKSTLEKFVFARAISDVSLIENIFNVPKFSMKIAVEQKSIMGVSIPKYSIVDDEDDSNKSIFNYSLNMTVPKLDEAVLSMQSLKLKLFELAQKEKACSLLSVEIEKTRRRVNALEHIMIPQLNETISYIQMKLDENERSALARLMQVKDALEKQEN